MQGKNKSFYVCGKQTFSILIQVNKLTVYVSATPVALFITVMRLMLTVFWRYIQCCQLIGQLGVSSFPSKSHQKCERENIVHHLCSWWCPPSLLPDFYSLFDPTFESVLFSTNNFRIPPLRVTDNNP